jgi:transposase
MVLPHRKSFSVDNNAAGYSELVKRLRSLSIAAIGIEPSGGYERAVIQALLTADLSVRRVNPNKLRQFSRARGVLAKNDAAWRGSRPISFCSTNALLRSLPAMPISLGVINS